MKISGGGGHYKFSPGCSRYNYSAHVQEAEIAVQQRIAIKTPADASTTWSKITPTYISFEATGGIGVKTFPKAEEYGFGFGLEYHLP